MPILHIYRVKQFKMMKRSLSYYRNISRLWGKKRKEIVKFNLVIPAEVSPQKTVPAFINKPSYHQSGIPTPGPNEPEIKLADQIEKIRASCKLAAGILKEVEQYIRVGRTTDEIDCLVHDLTIQNKAYPSPLNYKLFPKSVCTSVNNVACHGIPDARPLQDGDIINVDITVFLDGYHGDCSKTFPVGQIDEQAHNLMKYTKSCLSDAIAICKPDEAFCTIGKAIQRRAKQGGFAVIPHFIGHGIGQYFHGPPDIYHYRNRYPGTMQPGMTFTIEPILSEGGNEIEILEDNWTAVTRDNSRSAQFEHTVLITHDGVEILTLSD